MIISEDPLKSFIPTKKPRLVILGTMCSIKARKIAGGESADDAFYYYSPNNHFWKILQLVFAPKSTPKKMTKPQKEAFLDRHRIGITNIVHRIKIPKEKVKDVSDALIFKAYNSKPKRAWLKNVDKPTKKMLDSTPLFFTSSGSKPIKGLVRAYFEQIGLGDRAKEVEYLLTPTRCSPEERALGWKIRMARRGVKTQSILVPEDFIG